MDSTPSETIECPKCCKTFNFKSHLSRHLQMPCVTMVTHDPDAKVNCQVCGKISKNPAALSLHMARLHTNRKRPSCDIGLVFHNSVSLRSHTETMHNPGERPRLQCWFPGCEKTYQNRCTVWKHVRTEHVENPVRFPCGLCEKGFKTRADLEQHITTHTTEKPFSCDTCGRSFALGGNLKRHERTHLEKSSREIFKCQLCPSTSFRKSHLQNHIRFVHEKQKNYPCSYCKQKWRSAGDLKRHVEGRHPTNKEFHSCDKCDYKSHSKGNLVQHVRTHNVENWRECYFCKKQFTGFQILVRHCSRVHCLEK